MHERHSPNFALGSSSFSKSYPVNGALHLVLNRDTTLRSAYWLRQHASQYITTRQFSSILMDRRFPRWFGGGCATMQSEAFAIEPTFKQPPGSN